MSHLNFLLLFGLPQLQLLYPVALQFSNRPRIYNIDAVLVLIITNDRNSQSFISSPDRGKEWFLSNLFAKKVFYIVTSSNS